MSTYRCYLLDELDCIKSFVELRALSDSGATAKAQRYAQWARRPFELWRGRDMIYRSRSRREVSQSAERYRGYARELRALAQDYDGEATRIMFEQLAVSYDCIASSLDALEAAS